MSKAALWTVILLVGVLSGCATKQFETRPFFRQEQVRESHGRKTWFDHIVEVDPGGMYLETSADYLQNPPSRIAILPFTDLGSAQYVVDKIPLSFRGEDARADWAWTYAQRLRRALTGYLAQREFKVINLIEIDTVLADHGIDNYRKLNAVSPQKLGEWLGADAVMYGDVNHYEAYYAFLVAAWQVGMSARLVSTADGHEYLNAGGSRYAVDLRPAFSLEDIAINSLMSLLQLRDVTLARAEEEVCREFVKRIPESEVLKQRLVTEARRRAEEGEAAAQRRDRQAVRTPVQAPEVYRARLARLGQANRIKTTAHP